jgi:hypothetical protein
MPLPRLGIAHFTTVGVEPLDYAAMATRRKLPGEGTLPLAELLSAIPKECRRIMRAAFMKLRSELFEMS